MNAKQLRSSPRWKRVRAQVLRDATSCGICHADLFPDARPRSRWSSSVDHIVPLELGGAPFDLSNLRAVHLGCNSRIGARVGWSRTSKLPERASWERLVEPSNPADWLGGPAERAAWW